MLSPIQSMLDLRALLLCICIVLIVITSVSTHESFVVVDKRSRVPKYTSLAKLLPPQHAQYPPDTPDVVPLFWTGGLFSTYRLCDLIVRQRRRVRPLYIIPTGIDRRPTALNEIQAMRKIQEEFTKTFPTFQNMLLDTHMIVIQPIHAEVRRQLDAVLGLRASRLYGALAQASYILRPTHPIEWVLSEYTPQHRLRGHVIGVIQKKNSTSCAFDGKHSINRVFAQLYAHIRFILAGATRCKKTSRMTKKKAKQFGFYHLLQKYTWTCWYPQKRIISNGDPVLSQPCNQCAQCSARSKWL